MPYRLIMEVQDEQNVEQAQREFETMDDAKAYAHQQVSGDIYWTVREGHWDGLAPGYALRIESVETGIGNRTAPIQTGFRGLLLRCVQKEAR